LCPLFLAAVRAFVVFLPLLPALSFLLQPIPASSVRTCRSFWSLRLSAPLRFSAARRE